MPKGPDEKQKQHDKNLEDAIAADIANDIDAKKSGGKDDDDAGKSTEETKSVTDSKKEVDNNNDKSDTDSTSDDAPDERQAYDAVVQKVLKEELNGDESRMDEAKRIANIAIKTFNGNPLKAAKSYNILFKEKSDLDSAIKKNQFLENLIEEAKQGKNIDENYVKSLLGTATSNAENPPDSQKDNTKADHDQLEDDFDLDSLTAKELIESEVLDKQKYENADAVDRKDMVEKARIKYGYKVLPGKIAERSAKLTQKKQQDAKFEEKKQQAIDTNKERIKQSTSEVLTKYDVDFEHNPEHKRLWDEIKQTAYRVADLADDDGMLVAPNAIEQATKHVFDKHGVELRSSQITDDATTKSTDEHKQDRMASGDIDAMNRILGDVNGFTGKASKRNKSTPSNEGNTLDERVDERVQQEMNRGRRTSHMISNVRKADNKKPT